jgi:RHS repeat-associated protein
LVEAINPLPSNPLESFQYDAVGNRTTSNQNGASGFNVANQLLEDVNFTYQYDNNGNLTKKTAKVGGAITSYEYDAENKLVRVVSNGTTINYRYDGLGRRVEKEINDGTTTKVARFVFDNEDILLELDGSNNITARYTHGPGIDEPLIMEKDGASFFYHPDGLGSISEITNSSGAVAQRYTYSSFSKIESQLDPAFVQPYTFTAREFDAETGLYFYRNRTLDPFTGRFLQEDPRRGLINFPQTLNRYPYVGNNPVGRVDPDGEVILEATLLFLAGQAVALGVAYGGVQIAQLIANTLNALTCDPRRIKNDEINKAFQVGALASVAPAAQIAAIEVGLAAVPAVTSAVIQNPQMIQNAADFVDGAVLPGPPPPSLPGYLGGLYGRLVETISDLFK